ncbi:MAG: DDE-type integrase/transposase/recombinase [Proteobacteria bacterium]|nr:DDE-type integrase/transposase/recombinase [Pseudomonadota bacterium]
MSTATIQRNSAYLFEGRRYIVRRKLDEQTWQVEEEKTGRLSEQTSKELQTLYASHALTFDSKADVRAQGAPGSLPHRRVKVSDAEWADAKVRRAYAMAAMGLNARKTLLMESIQKTWEKLRQPVKPPHWTTVYRWRRSLNDHGLDVTAVVAKVEAKGNRQRRYERDVTDIVEDAVDLVYMTPERKTLQDALDKAVLNTKAANRLRPESMQLALPTRRLVARIIKRIPAFDRCLARYGRTVANHRFRGMLGHRVTDAPLRRAEIDHTLLDLMVVDDETGLPLGRPLLTLCVDDYTRCILGYHVGFEPPSYMTVARCLRHAFLPKWNLEVEHPEVKHTWVAHGVMYELAMDNGLEFHSRSLEEVCYRLGIEIHYGPRLTPWFKGKVERLQGTLNREVAHGNPGTTFSDIFDRGDYDPVEHAVIRLSVLRRIILMWIVDVYHQRPHRALHVPPDEMWSKCVKTEDIRVPEDPTLLDAVMGRREERTLTHKGIELEGLFYNSQDLIHLRRQYGEKIKVEISIDDGDIGTIVVFSPNESDYFVVPALKSDYAKGLSRWQHKICQRYAAKHLESFDATGWLEAKERIAQMVRDEFALKASRVKSRRRAARYVEAGRSASTPSPAQLAHTPSPKAPPLAPADTAAELTPEPMTEKSPATVAADPPTPDPATPASPAMAKASGSRRTGRQPAAATRSRTTNSDSASGDRPKYVPQQRARLRTPLGSSRP